MQRANRVIEQQLRERRGSGCDDRTAADRYPRRHVGGREMQMHRRPVLERFRFRGEHADAHVEALRRTVDRRVEHPVAAAGGLEIGAGEIQRATLARRRLVRRFALNLDGAHAHRRARRRNHQLVARFHDAVEHGAGDHGAAAGDRERAVDGQPEVLTRRPPRGLRRGFARQQFAQLRDARAAYC
jgi:hypothetical protein